MEYRTLGRTGLRVSDVGFGAMTIGGEVFGATDDNESLKALHHALDVGMNFIDTADAYGHGHSEELIAQVLKTRRKEVVLATKGGNQYMVRQGLRNFEPEYISGALERSLQRLQIDAIDLYQLHNPSAEVMQRGEIFELLDRFKREGKIRFYGVSLETVADGIVALQTGKPDTLQVVYNILHQDPEAELFPLAQAHNIGIIRPRSAGTGRTLRPLYEPEPLRPRRFSRPDVFRKVFGAVDFRAGETRLPGNGDVPNLAQAALRFVLSHPAVSSVIPGIRTPSQVDANAAASGKRLPAEDLARLRELYQSEFRSIGFH